MMTSNFMRKAADRAGELLRTTKPPISESDLDALLVSTLQREFPNLTIHGTRRAIEIAYGELSHEVDRHDVMVAAADAAYRRDHGGASVDQTISVPWFFENCPGEAEAIIWESERRRDEPGVSDGEPDEKTKMN
jgi:hypothetical protein